MNPFFSFLADPPSPPPPPPREEVEPDRCRLGVVSSSSESRAALVVRGVCTREAEERMERAEEAVLARGRVVGVESAWLSCQMGLLSDWAQ